MKIFNRAFCYVGGILILGIVIAGVYVLSPSSNPPSKTPDYSSYTAEVSVQFPDGQKSIGYACVYQQKNEILLLQTAKHLVQEKKYSYFVTFHNGISKKIEAVRIPDEKADIAILEIKHANLQSGREYNIPIFIENKMPVTGKSVYVYGDEYYKNIERKILACSYIGNIRYVTWAGNIEQGRSGSPVFLKGTNCCIGIISGYFTKSSSQGERVLSQCYSPNNIK